MLGRTLTTAALGFALLAALGCRTPAERSRIAHAKFDPQVDRLVQRTDAELAKEMPPYRSIVDQHDKWANYLALYAQRAKDHTFNASIAMLYRRNADIYDLLEEPQNAEKYRSLASQYDPDGSGSGGGAVVDAGADHPAVAAGVAQAPDSGDPEPPPPSAEPEVRARIAVLPLDEPNATKESYGYGEQYSGFLHTAFDRFGRFDLIERSAIRQVLQERNLAETQVEGDAAKELGKLLQVDILVVGFIGPNPDHSVFNVTTRLVSTATGKSVVSAADTIREGNAGFNASSKKLAQEIAGLYNQRR